MTDLFESYRNYAGALLLLMLMLLCLPAWAEGEDVRMLDQGSGIGIHTPSKALIRNAQKGHTSWVEPDTDRPGADYRSFHTREGPGVCQEVCADDPRCRAYTYIKPGYYMRHKVIYGWCFLKSAVPEPVGNDCCVSGVKPQKKEKPLTKEVTPSESAGGRGEGGVVLVRPIEPPQMGMGSGKTEQSVNPSGSLKEAKGSPEVKKSPEVPPAQTTRPSGVTPPVTPSESQRGQPVITRNKPVKPAKQSRPHKETAEDIIRSIDLGEENRRQKMAGIPRHNSRQEPSSPYGDILKAIKKSPAARIKESEKTTHLYPHRTPSLPSEKEFQNKASVGNSLSVPPKGIFTSTFPMETGIRDIEGVNFLAQPLSGTGKRVMKDVNLDLLLNLTAKRELKGINITAIPLEGKGVRTISAVDFRSIPSAASGKREIAGVDFTTMPRMAAMVRELKANDFIAQPMRGIGAREIKAVDFSVSPRNGTGKRLIAGVNFKAIQRK